MPLVSRRLGRLGWEPRATTLWRRNLLRLSCRQPGALRLKANPSAESELPPELQGLRINEEGELIDEKSGEVINECTATRFDVAVRALRGEFDPPAGVDNTERTPGLLLDSLVTFPTEYTFNIVIKPAAGSSRSSSNGSGEGGGGSSVQQQLLEEMAGLVARVCEAEVRPELCAAKERMGGKYISLAIPAVVRAPEIVQSVFKELSKDGRVLMKY